MARGNGPSEQMRGHDIILLGASTGGLKVVSQVLRELPPDLPAAIFVTIHIAPHVPSHLASILDGTTMLSVEVPEDGMPIERGHVYVAPRDRHMLVERERVRVVRGPKENRHRPAVDPMFRSAAWAHGPYVAAAVLTGWLDDGTAGLWAVKSSGGVAIVQTPEDAEAYGMPDSALANVEVDHIVPATGLASLLTQLARDPVTSITPVEKPEKLGVELGFATMDRDIKDMSALGRPSAFTCPSCRGALWELHDGELLRFRCHVGHAFSAQSLLQEQDVALEDALYSAIRALEEKAASSRRIGEHLRTTVPKAKERYEATARELDASADVLRRVLCQGRPG